jgi:hypothetical protein
LLCIWGIARPFVAVNSSGLQRLDIAPDVFLALAEPVLEASKHLLFLALGEGQIVVREVGVLLLQLPFDFVPVAFISSLVMPQDRR